MALLGGFNLLFELYNGLARDWLVFAAELGLGTLDVDFLAQVRDTWSGKLTSRYTKEGGFTSDLVHTTATLSFRPPEASHSMGACRERIQYREDLIDWSVMAR